MLVLTTPNIVSLRALNAVIQGSHPGFYNRYPDPYGQFADDSRHEREYTPVEICKLLEAAGYGSLEELAMAVFGDAVSPAICAEPDCDHVAEMEPDQDAAR